ncbi:MAG TPA: sigma-70 family RNA polymerase sigma factor [Rhizomicrobium sp.]|nr:sigma-70 family RNA polymerase sigma factor [Rhizomicrobium sp.]
MTRTDIQPREDREPQPAPDFKTDLLALVPFLRAFARSLTGNYESADDLVQETLVKAWQSRDTFELGTNLKAWLFTILRNQFYSDRRRAWRQAPWDQDAAERMPGTSQDQNWAADLSDTARALKLLPDEQREALILVGAGGFSYMDAASIVKCNVGTVKSRVARARKALLAILDKQDSLPQRQRPDEGEAARDIMAQLDALSSAHEPEAPARRRKKGHAG